MDFRGYLSVLRRNLLLILLITAAVVAAIGAYSYRTEASYQSTARVIFSSAQAETTAAYAGGLLSEQRASTYVELVDSGLLAEQVREDLGLDSSIEDLVEQVEASAVDESSVLEVRVTHEDPELAQLIAQTYAEKLVETAKEIETPDDAKAPIKVTIIDQASFSDTPVAPKPVRNMILGGILGLVLGVSLALLRELLDTSIKSADDLEQVTTAPLLGSIIGDSAASRGLLVSELDAHAPRVESFRVLRTNIQFVDVDSADKVFVISSSVKGEGKTSTAVNLAITLARAGVRTLLVDGDLRRPKVAEMLGLDGSVGVTTALLGKVSFKDAIQTHPGTGLNVMASGISPPNSSELLQSNAMAALIAQMRSGFEVVLFDSPPLLPVTDAALLAARSDGALLVVRHGKTTRDQLATAVDRLAQVDVEPVGIVMNAVPASRSVLGYSYKTYGAYGAYGPAAEGGNRKSERRRGLRRGGR